MVLLYGPTTCNLEIYHAARIRLCLGSLGLFITPMLFFVISVALTPDAYEDECEFADHAGSFKGRRQFKRNCPSLSQNPIFPSHRAFILW
ncbi:hypothetical protein Hanom_Chr00s006308g01733181 [Helianthus anomalus]